MMTELTDEQIIQHLRQKETTLLIQLEKVRIALSALISDEVSGLTIKEQPVYQKGSGVLYKYDEYLSYEEKVILALSSIGSGYVQNMKEYLISIGDTTDENKLFSGLTGAASRLLKDKILIADTRRKRYRYELNPENEKEATGFLSLLK